MKLTAINKHYGKLKMMSGEIPNAPYSNRCAAYKKKSQPTNSTFGFCQRSHRITNRIRNTENK